MKTDPFPRIILSRPLITAVVIYIAGLYLGRTFDIEYTFSLRLLSLLAFFLLIAFFFFKNRLPYVVLLFFFPLGLFLSQINSYLYEGRENITSYTDGEKVIVEGTVLDRKDEGAGKKILIESSGLFDSGKVFPLTGRILLTLAEGGENIVPSQIMRFMAKLKSPRNFGNPGNFDYETYLHERGIYGTAFLKDDTSLALIDGNNLLWEKIYDYRKKISNAIGESSLKESRGIIAAISIGDRGYIEEALMTAFRKSGVAHLLAISGLHMGIVAFFFFKLFRWLLARSERVLLYNMAGKGAAIITLFPLTLYLLASGMATSAVRAYIMVLVFLFSVVMERESAIYNTIALAALLILFIWPLALFDVAFQLSFIAVLSIVYFVPKLESFFNRFYDLQERLWAGKILTFALVSFAASLGTAPLTAFYFSEVSFSAVLSNLLIIPLAGFIAVPLTSLALFVSLVSMETAKLLFLTASLVMKVPILIAQYIGSIPHSSTIVIPPSFAGILIYYLLLVLIFSSKREVRISGMLMVPLFLMFLMPLNRKNDDLTGKLRVTFISVGQGESTLIGFPRGKTMLIDGGGVYDNAFDVGRMVLRPFLLSQGIKKLDYVVMTHPHPDHMYGLLHIVSAFHVSELWTNGIPPADDIYSEILETAEKKGIKEKVKNDLSSDLEIDGVKIHFLNPPEKGMTFGSGSAINNGSIVMKMIFGKKSFLFTGDLEKGGESRLLGGSDDLKSHVIKVAHHGSRTSSTKEFVNAVHPEYAVFSVGYNNRFKFPVEEIVMRYKALGSEIFRTDESGAITFLTDGSRLEVSTFR